MVRVLLPIKPRRYSSVDLIKKFRYLIRILPRKEKIFFLVLAVIFLISSAGIIKQAASLVLVDAPADGGEIKEGIIGTPRFINPALAISDADRDLTILVYSGLLRRDGQGNLIPDLAENYKISEDGLSYIFKIRDNAVWHDNKPVTSDDVIFTVETIKNGLIKSPKQASWEGVAIQRINDKEISFSLKRPYAPFLENATLGILPKHIWEKIPPEQFSLNASNIKPMG
ncbi:MAG: ABC transporter substrate-binding protein, partial [Patescibacteria group bacterium]